jgi:lipoprotein-anchoring transpeptidase ErfK/SrfK
MKLRAPLAVATLTVSLLATAAGTASAGAAARPHPSPTRLVALAKPLAARALSASGLTIAAAPKASAPTTMLPATTEFGSPRVLLATARKAGWYRVSLPTRPNGATGWVRARDVSLGTLRDDVRVDLAARTLTWRRDGRIALETPVAVGAPETPTPAGAFFVTDLLDNADDSGPYGPYALGVSAHSDTLSEFAGGDGRIGIHGTDAPDSIGQAVSHGCVRVPNDVVALLAQSLPLGTPVTIA